MDRVNDFAFKIATANGTGSASANGLLMQSIFRMGIPVTGKNVFPSNIQGLPTWYEIRVSKDGYTARTPYFDLMVALNAATYQKDVAEVRTGVGLLGAVELSDPTKLVPVIDEARARGVLVRAIRGVALQISPPFVITEEEIATLARVIGESLDAAA